MSDKVFLQYLLDQMVLRVKGIRGAGKGVDFDQSTGQYPGHDEMIWDETDAVLIGSLPLPRQRQVQWPCLLSAMITSHDRSVTVPLN
jgi:hypothetical protein